MPEFNITLTYKFNIEAETADEAYEYFSDHYVISDYNPDEILVDEVE
jgi:hypothetical protein